MNNHKCKIRNNDGYIYMLEKNIFNFVSILIMDVQVQSY